MSKETEVSCCETCKQPLPKIEIPKLQVRSIWEADAEFKEIADVLSKTRCYAGIATAIRFSRDVPNWNIIKDDKAAMLPYVTIGSKKSRQRHRTMFYHKGKFFSDTLKQDIDFVREPLTKPVE